MMTDPISDMATRIRNGLRVEATFVDLPNSKTKMSIAAVLQREGFIWDFEVRNSDSNSTSSLRLNLKYGPNGERVIRSIKRISKPGRRIYLACSDIPKVIGGMGISVVSTSKGVVSDREARSLGVGGELLVEIF